jgi:hypothetical protein
LLYKTISKLFLKTGFLTSKNFFFSALCLA